MNVIDKIRGGLSKLTIIAYKDVALTTEVGRMEAMYNPEALSLDYAARYEEEPALNDPIQTTAFVDANAGRLDIQLIFDGSLPTHREPVEAQLSRLRSLCCVVDATSGQTRFLKIQWGSFNWHGHGYFACRMERLSVRYTLFDRDGSPLRATASLNVIEDVEPGIQRAKLGVRNPQPSVVQVIAGTGLSLMAAAQSATVGAVMVDKPPVDYLELAKANDLDHLDAIRPGQALAWPAGKGA
ncbi:hypothetical protein [Robbsia andropogonis]|uniref:CIS tube protein n=1 Tax=Robbsia andropogonis TaxID=28092 RepID=UPI000B054F01|nr:hypothetical protein [Robbsia andropogonis]